MEILDKIESKTATVAVIGLGYVGMPVATCFAEEGYRVIGFDVDVSKVETVNSGRSHIADISDERISALVEAGLVHATADPESLEQADAIIICVPTPLNKAREPDLSFVRNAAELIEERLRPGQLVVLESTTYPGTTQEIVHPILSRSGLKVGEDFYLAYSPERIDPGSANFNMKNTPKVMGGTTPACLEAVTRLYGKVVDRVVPVSSTSVAEMTKIFENVFRVVNVAVVNEMAILCDRMGIDVWEVLEAAGTKPFGIMKFNPGPGVGGHCIPVDPFYLTWKAREYDFYTKFIELAGETNIHMPYFVRTKVARALNSRRKSVNGSKILVLGLAYKPDVADDRESPAYKVIELLQSEGGDVSYNDPLIPTTSHHSGLLLRSVQLTEDVLRESDCVVIVTNHSAYDYEWIVANSALVVDTRGVTRKLNGRYADKVVLL